MELAAIVAAIVVMILVVGLFACVVAALWRP